MIFDTHFHTEFSADSKEKIENHIEKAKQMGIGLTVTDHLDLICDWSFNPIEYKDKYGALRNEGFFLGVECGMDLNYTEASRDFIYKFSPDFVLGSMHTLEGRDIFPRGANYFDGISREEFYRKYFRETLICLKAHPYINSLSHIDYPVRYIPFEKREFRYMEFKEDIDELFGYMIVNGIALELNTRRFNKDTMEHFTDIYGAYKKLGGEMITLGSDAHRIDNLGDRIFDAYEFITSLGLKAVHFEGGNPVIDKI